MGGYVCIIFSLSVDGYLVCFHILATVNNGTVNVGVQIPLRVGDFISFGIYEMAGSYSSSFIFNFLRNSLPFSIAAVPIYILTNSAEGFSFLYILTNTYCLLTLKNPYLFIYLFIHLFISKREEGGRERKKERRIDLLFHLFMHSLVDPCMRPGWASTLQPWCAGMTL